MPPPLVTPLDQHCVILIEVLLENLHWSVRVGGIDKHFVYQQPSCVLQNNDWVNTAYLVDLVCQTLVHILLQCQPLTLSQSRHLHNPNRKCPWFYKMLWLNYVFASSSSQSHLLEIKELGTKCDRRLLWYLVALMYYTSLFGFIDKINSNSRF